MAVALDSMTDNSVEAVASQWNREATNSLALECLIPGARKQNTWFTKELGLMKRHLIQLQRRWQKTRTEYDLAFVKIHSRAYSAALAKAKAAYMASSIPSARLCPAGIFRVEGCVMHPGSSEEKGAVSGTICDHSAHHVAGKRDRMYTQWTPV